METTTRWNLALRWSFATAAVVWALALPVAAWSAATNGAAAIVHVPAALAYAIGALVCHQQAARSFTLAGVQWPVCARCTGIYAGAAVVGAMFVASAGRQRRALDLRRARGALLAAPVPILLTLAFEWTTGLTPSNLVRALSGVPPGAVVAWVIVRSSPGDGSAGPAGRPTSEIH